ncbi:MAG: diguanylate cyclase [Candidatus Muiribacteriaceae bacterium]
MDRRDFFEDDTIKISMQTKLMILFLIVGIIPIIILGLRAFNDQKKTIKDLIITQNSKIANIVAQELNEKIITAHKMLISTSKIPSLQTQGKEFGEEIETILRTTLNNFKIFRNIYYIDSFGNNGLAALNRSGIIKVSKLSEITDIDPNVVKYWYFGSVRGQSVKKGFYSEVYFSGDGKKSEPLQLMGVYVKDELYNTVGLLIAEISIKEIYDIVDRIKIGETGYAFVIDEKSGRLIAHSNKDIFEPGMKFLSQEKIDEIGSLGVDGVGGMTFLDSRNSEKFVSYVSTNLYRKELYKAQNFFTPHWGIVVEQTVQEGFKPSRKLMVRIFYILILGSGLSIILAIIFAHGVTRSLKMLHQGALTITKGDLSQDLYVDSDDEIGELARAFDEMRVNLKKKMNDLKILYEISQTISAVLDYKELLTEVMEIAIKVLEAEKGSIMLFDDETEMLRIEAAYGLPYEITQDTLINPNKGIVGWVIRTGKPLLIYDTMKEAGFEKLKGRKAESGTLLSAPLKVKDKLLGVVNVSKSIPNTYNDSDRELFSAIALQAAIAIDKALLYRRAITDGLTKLYQHRYFQQRFEEELQRSQRYSKPISLLMMDIDHFKNFNDTYGHQVGDRVLKIVARIIEKSIRDVDIAARYGGEEFAVILPEMTSEGAEVPAERIRSNIENYDFYVDDKVVPITVSLGVSTFPDNASEKDQLIECADNALYYSKETGRNKVSVFSEEVLKDLNKLKGKG